MTAPAPATTRRWRTRTVMLALGSIALLGGGAWLVLTGSIAVRGEVAILEADPRPQAQLFVVVAACGSQPHVTTLEETAGSVRVGVSIWRHFRTGGDDCADSIVIDLNEPLGQRTVIDASTGQPVPPPD